jgi:hypothetical protein
MWGKKKELYVLAFQMKKRSQGRKGGQNSNDAKNKIKYTVWFWCASGMSCNECYEE